MCFLLQFLTSSPPFQDQSEPEKGWEFQDVQASTWVGISIERDPGGLDKWEGKRRMKCKNQGPQGLLNLLKKKKKNKQTQAPIPQNSQ